TPRSVGERLGAVAPGDGHYEVEGPSAGVGVRKAGAQASRTDSLGPARGAGRTRRQGGVGHRGRAAVAGGAAAVVVDRHRDAVRRWRLFGLLVRAADRVAT